MTFPNIDLLPVIDIADGFITITCKENHRLSISTSIARLIDMLDAMEPDPDFEASADSWFDEDLEQDCDADDQCDDEGAPCADEEHSLGWENEGSQATLRASLADAEPDLGTTEETDQVRRLHEHPGVFDRDGEPSLGFAGHGTGWRQGEETDDREGGNELEGDKADFEPFLGWSEHQSEHGAQPTGEEFPIDGGVAKFDGSGHREAETALQAADAKPRDHYAGPFWERAAVMPDGGVFRTFVPASNNPTEGGRQ